jgi:hypothetical protein
LARPPGGPHRGPSGIAPLSRKLRFLDNSKKHFAEIYGYLFLGLVVLVVLPWINETQTFVVCDGIDGAGLASGAIVGGQLACDRRR